MRLIVVSALERLFQCLPESWYCEGDGGLCVDLPSEARTPESWCKDQFKLVTRIQNENGLTKEEIVCCTDFLVQEGLCKMVRVKKRSLFGTAPVQNNTTLALVQCHSWYKKHMNRIVDKFEKWCTEREPNSVPDLLTGQVAQSAQQSQTSVTTPPVPDSIKCPLSLSVMQDPVVAEDGHTYERASIERWFRTGNRTSPLTRERIGTKLIPSHTLKKLIEELGCATT